MSLKTLKMHQGLNMMLFAQVGKGGIVFEGGRGVPGAS